MANQQNFFPPFLFKKKGVSSEPLSSWWDLLGQQREFLLRL
jgi:hypothetical protein